MSELDKKKGNSFVNFIKRYFFTGLLISAPIGATIYITIFIVEFIAGLVPQRFNPNGLLPEIIGYEIPGLELIIAFLSFILIGLIFSTLFGKAILGYFDNLITRIPFAGNVYKAIKQITETFSNADAAYQKVVLIEYPRKDIYAIGFMTGETKGEIKDRKKIDMVNVFVPTTPNPTSGFLLFIPKEDAVELDMSVEDAIKLVVSAGMVVPPTK
ncbi:DUF502 domain-containing protein [Pelagibacteraceae bacterium]|jgi:uncharacterized membrane protein|nr:DUF502 domain-containing protein [Pelagibacteraceae bacterium]MDC3204810.1 DUF502 domain-containing protein [Pelagibacteraceae bacterium]|tara:strand:- start:37 stop:675 length:639 start_codon:yes stop_codon:yes gene_type:complete